MSVAGGAVALEPVVTLEDFGYGTTPALNHDGSLLFAVGSRSAEEAEYRGPVVIGAATGRVKVRLRWRYTGGGTTAGVQSAAFSPDSSLLAVAGPESVRVYDVATGREKCWVRSMPEPDAEGPKEDYQGWEHGLAFSPDGKRLASATGRMLRPRVVIWDVKDLPVR